MLICYIFTCLQLQFEFTCTEHQLLSICIKKEPYTFILWKPYFEVYAVVYLYGGYNQTEQWWKSSHQHLVCDCTYIYGWYLLSAGYEILRNVSKLLEVWTTETTAYKGAINTSNCWVITISPTSFHSQTVSRKREHLTETAAEETEGSPELLPCCRNWKWGLLWIPLYLNVWELPFYAVNSQECGREA